MAPAPVEHPHGVRAAGFVDRVVGGVDLRCERSAEAERVVAARRHSCVTDGSAPCLPGRVAGARVEGGQARQGGDVCRVGTRVHVDVAWVAADRDRGRRHGRGIGGRRGRCRWRCRSSRRCRPRSWPRRRCGRAGRRRSPTAQARPVPWPGSARSRTSPSALQLARRPRRPCCLPRSSRTPCGSQRRRRPRSGSSPTLIVGHGPAHLDTARAVTPPRVDHGHGVPPWPGPSGLLPLAT